MIDFNIHLAFLVVRVTGGSDFGWNLLVNFNGLTTRFKYIYINYRISLNFKVEVLARLNCLDWKD